MKGTRVVAVTAAVLSLSSLLLLIFSFLLSTRTSFSIGGDHRPPSREHVPQSGLICNWTLATLDAVDRDFRTAPLRYSPADVDRQLAWSEEKNHPVSLFQIEGDKIYHVRRSVEWHFQSRGEAILALLQNTLKKFPGEVGDMDVLYFENDAWWVEEVKAPILIHAKLPHQKGLVRIPDFTMMSWPEAYAYKWEDKRKSLLALSYKLPFAERKKKAFWVGNVGTSIDRGILRDWMDSNPLSKLLMEFRNHDLADRNGTTPLEDHCYYRYLIHLRGISYSARLKYLLACGSLVFFLVRDGDMQREMYREYWYDHLIRLGEQGQPHLILVRSPQHLYEQLQYYEAHEEEARVIAERGRAFVENFLHMDAIYCHYLKILQTLQSRFQLDVRPGREVPHIRSDWVE